MIALDASVRAGSSLALVAAVWTLLALGGALRSWIGPSAATAVCFTAATIVVVARRPARGARPTRISAARVLLACAAGALSLPAWVAVLTPVGRILGLPLRPPAAPIGFALWSWLSVGVLAPLFEELLYRERLIPALAPRLGRAGATLAASALFALPHLEPWNVLAAFACGLLLGAAFCVTGTVAPCIAYHAGANWAAALAGVPPERIPLGPLASTLVASACLGLALFGTPRR